MTIASWAITEGDCIDVLRGLPAASADLVVADPPYGMAFQSGRREARLAPILNDERPFIWWLADAFRVTAADGALVCFCRWNEQEIFRMAIAAAGFTVRSQGIWDRERHGMGNLAQQLAPQHDVIWFATKGRFRFRGLRPRSVVRAVSPTVAAAGHRITHPNEKPVGAYLSLIRGCLGATGGHVLDPFAGIGSAGEAALIAGCSYHGIELDPHYAALARERLARCLGAVEREAA